MIKLAVSDCVLWKDSLICVARDYNVLFSIDISTGEISLMESIPCCGMTDSAIGGVTIIDNCLIVSTIKSNYNWIVNLTTGEKKSINKGREPFETNPGFVCSYEFGGRVYMIGASYEAIICVDLSDYSTEFITSPYKECEKRGKHKEDAILTKGCRVGNRLYFGSMRDNYVLIFDMEIEQYKWECVGSEDNRYSGIIFDGNEFWLSPRLNTSIVKWNEDQVDEIQLPEEFGQARVYFKGIGLKGNSVILPNVFNEQSIVIDRCSCELGIMSKQYTFYRNLENKYIVYQEGNGMLGISGGDINREYYPLIDSREMLSFFANRHINKSREENVLFEDKYLDVEYYMSFVV